MNCDEALLLMSEELAGSLEQEQEAALQAHLAQCADCRQTYAQLHMLDDALQDAELTPPAELHDEVMKKIRAEKRHGRHPWGPAAVIAAVLALVLIGGRMGVLSLPGFGGDGALANDASHAAQSVLKGQTQDDAARG